MRIHLARMEECIIDVRELILLKIKKITLLAYPAMSKPSLKYQQFEDREWYSLRSILGNDWAMFYMLLGGREAGKSYAVTKF